MANSGQICFAATRVYVQSGIYDKFIDAYVKALQSKDNVVGDPEDKATQIGPVVDKLQYERIMGIIETAAKEKQGTLLAGGRPAHSKVRSIIGIAIAYCGFTDLTFRQGYYIEPTVFTDTTEGAMIYKDEIFGPVVVINKFEKEDEIIERSNDSNYGLMAGVFTQDINRALRVSSAIDSGVVGINCISTVTFSCPFGGTKESGLGREMGEHALRAYTEPKTVLINVSY